MKNYELPISPNYVCNWGIKEAIREILQNAIDADSSGYSMKVVYNENINQLQIINDNASSSVSSLVLGCSSKTDIENMIGKFGEGYKLALVVLLRKGMGVTIYNGKETWSPSFQYSDNYKTQVLNIDISVNENSDEDYVEFCIDGINRDLYNELLIYFPCINEDFGDVIESDNGQILLDEQFKGKMYVEGLYIQSDSNFKYGYNFNANVVDLDRDRKAINYYELKRLTASAIVGAEECRPELFKAISDSYTDVKDIKDVIDDANDEFLKQYRDMLYESKGLDENTLIATESVMRQLEQMDIDVPVAKGSEIESYLVAKANNQLGLIYEAKEAASKKSDEDEAWWYVSVSRWIKFKYWINKYKEQLSAEALEDLEYLISSFEPSELSYIAKYIPDDFVWTEKNFNELEEKTKNQI